MKRMLGDAAEGLAVVGPVFPDQRLAFKARAQPQVAAVVEDEGDVAVVFAELELGREPAVPDVQPRDDRGPAHKRGIIDVAPEEAENRDAVGIQR